MKSPNSKLLSALTSILDESQRLTEEQRKLGIMERESKAAHDDTVKNGDPTSDRAVASLSLHLTRLQLIPGHRNRLNAECRANAARLRPALRAASDAWGDIVTARVDAEYKRLIDFAAPFYGSARAAKQVIHDDKIPALYDIRRAYWQGTPQPFPSDFAEIVAVVEAFTRHVEKYVSALALPLPE